LLRREHAGHTQYHLRSDYIFDGQTLFPSGAQEARQYGAILDQSVARSPLASTLENEVAVIPQRMTGQSRTHVVQRAADFQSACTLHVTQCRSALMKVIATGGTVGTA